MLHRYCTGTCMYVCQSHFGMHCGYFPFTSLHMRGQCMLATLTCTMCFISTVMLVRGTQLHCVYTYHNMQKFKKILSLTKMTKIFSVKFLLVIILYMANIWCTFDMNENFVPRKFLAQIFCKQN